MEDDASPNDKSVGCEENAENEDGEEAKMKRELEENEKGEEREEEEMNSNGAILKEDDKACDEDDQEIVQNDTEAGQNDQETVQDPSEVENEGQSVSEAAEALKLSEGVKEMSSAFEKQAKKEDVVKKGPADGNEGSRFKTIWTVFFWLLGLKKMFHHFTLWNLKQLFPSCFAC